MTVSSTTTLLINGKPYPLPSSEPIGLSPLLETLGYDSQSVAVAVDQCFVPRKQFASTLLQPGQTLDIVAPMQGG